MSFVLHPRLAAGSHFLGRRDGCHVLLKNNAAFPWLLIVPEVAAGEEDLHQLSPDLYAKVTILIRDVSVFTQAFFQADKLNVGCIGNMVRQMHIHVVARSEGDPAWPGTVWACDVKEPYREETVQEIIRAARAALGFDEDE